MIEKYTNEVILDVRRGDKEDLHNTIEEIKAYAKMYEHDKVTLINLKKSHSSVLDEERYIVLLQIERDKENLGRKYEYEEEKIVGFLRTKKSKRPSKMEVLLLFFFNLFLLSFFTFRAFRFTKRPCKE